MPALADAGYYVLAPDLRGYGRTTGWDESGDLEPSACSIWCRTALALLARWA